MRPPACCLIVALTAMTGLALGAQSPDLSFRTGVDSVLLTVSVKDSGRLVLNLSAKDFEVRDNNVVQAFEVSAPETLPIDITLIADVSGSARGPVLDSLTRALNSVGGHLRPQDRASLVTFNHRVREVRPLTAGWTPVTFAAGEGPTALFDATTAALITDPEAGRRRMAILLTDGNDTASFVDGSTLVDVAKRADTSVFVIAVTGGTAKAPRRTPYEALFQSLTQSTGGTLTTLQADQEIGSAFDKAFEQFGTSYVLRYTYKGPATKGWHPISVRVLRRGTYEVGTRDGYFVGGE